jgi:transcriptional regulator with XRE-family HTH domain
MKVGKYLKAAREDAHLMQLEVMEKTKISNKSLSNWENDVSSPSPRDLFALADLYGLSIDDLLGHRVISNRPQDILDYVKFGNYTIGGRLVRPEERERIFYGIIGIISSLSLGVET